MEFLAKHLRFCLSLIILAYWIMPSAAWGVPLKFDETPIATVGANGLTKIFRSENIVQLATQVTLVGKVIIIDNNSGVGGATGAFSGFDVDAIYLDEDGIFDTKADQFPSNFQSFKKCGTLRSQTASVYLDPSTNQPSCFASDFTPLGNGINDGLASLSTTDDTDGGPIGDAKGFLSLGDGGELEVTFNFGVGERQQLFVLIGEVGGQPGEGIMGASFELTENIIPEPGTFLLFGSGLIGLLAYRYRSRSDMGQPDESE